MRCLVALLMLACACLPQAWAQDFDEEVARSLVSRADAARLHELIEQEAPASLSARELNEFFLRQRRAAKSLGDPEAALAISRRRVAARPDALGARWALWRDLSATDNVEEANALGEQLLLRERTLVPGMSVHARGTALLAIDYLKIGRVDDAERLIKTAEDELAAAAAHRRHGDKQAFHVSYATGLVHEARCRLFALRARNDEAQLQCRLAIEAYDAGIEEGARFGETVRMNAAVRSVKARIHLAALLTYLGRPYDAERMLKDALDRSRASGVHGPLQLVEIYRHLALIRLGQHREPDALRLATEALKLAEECNAGTLGSETRSATQVLLRVLVAQSNWPEAMATLDKVDRLAAGRPQLQRRVLNVVPRALAYAHSGRAGQVVTMITAHLEARRRAVGPQHTETALAQGVRGIVLAALAGGARADEARSDLAAAVQVLGSPDAPGHELLELGEQSAVRRLVFERYLEILGERPTPSEVAAAFGAADLLSGSSVQRALSEAAARGAVKTPGLSEIVRRDQNARNELDVLYAYLSRHVADSEVERLDAVSAQMRPRIAELEKLRAALRTEIARGFPDYGRLVHPAPSSPVEVARQLGAHEVMVSVLAGRKQLHAWAITSDGDVRYQRTALAQTRVDALVRRLRDTLDVADRAAAAPAFDAAAASELYQRVLAPLEPALQGRSHIVVATRGTLGQIPFGVLVTRPPSPDAQPAWLIRQAAVSQVPSAGAWLAIKRLARAQTAAEALMAWGDPTFDPAAPTSAAGATRRIKLPHPPAPGSDLESEVARATIAYAQIPALPETREELLSIAATLRADPARDVLLGRGATRDSVLAANLDGRLARKRVLAFATHGLMAGDLPSLDQPALALAGVGRQLEDPLAALLTLDDVMGLKLNADWVVLSACNTAAADGEEQEALSGLARGFFYAGSRSLLVTHWAVETESAKLLTTGTFEYRAVHPDASKAESLRQAMLKVMAMPQYRHPAFWAPYALVGDGAP